MPTAVSSNTRCHIELSTKIASAYVSNNRVPAAELSTLLARIHDTILTPASETVVISASHDATVEGEARSLAEIRKFIQPSWLISFIDGSSYRTLKRNLTSHGFNPKSYRVRYGLSADYPKVAEEYRALRSALAIQMGLGVASSRSNLGHQ